MEEVAGYGLGVRNQAHRGKILFGDITHELYSLITLKSFKHCLVLVLR